MEAPEELFDHISLTVFGGNNRILNYRLVAAGNMNQAIYLNTEKGSFFLKTNFEEDSDIFPREREGLSWLRDNCSLYVPETLAQGQFEDRHYLLMDWISSAFPKPDYSSRLGEGLAELHMCTSRQFGLDKDNYIAILPQKNRWTDSWPAFFIENRLEPQLQLALYKGLVDQDFLRYFRSIYERLQEFFPSEKPALLHGDLWSGNVMTDASGLPALIDPAVYFGHREMDLAFSRLFGGFTSGFYEAYQAVFPLEPGFEERMPVYNLYPLLVHLNLFGKAYLSGIQKTLKRFAG
ncbi:Fructosamine-3-kinase [Cyclobacterium lianum]|uniref:Fructosamine-3-kinase n=1 Tax=Cyclobacterium lianum TaxID=388280 RepID=A0A1M7PQY1_9BACT|nr:fructosamine kinase family protein [Cyclobacterium lianum]SHN19744.1 Fructosamine-3-kinase [Cyclobacterium lianum]